MEREELIKFLKENLSLDVRTESCYNGCGLNLYEDYKVIELKLDGEIISTVDLE